MKSKLFTLLLAIAASVGTIFASVTIDGIAYNLNNETELTAEVTRGVNYSGSIVIPESIIYEEKTYSVTRIREQAFLGCTGLTSVEIPNSVTNIGMYAFEGCKSLTSVTINSDTIVSKSYSYNDNISSIFGSQVKKYILGDSVTSIGDYAFWYCTGLTSIEIPNSVTSIGNYGFGGCTGLTSVTIPNSVTSIGASAFRDCTGLTSIEIPNSVTSIGDGAFYDCENMTSIEIPNSVTSIGNNAFEGCTKLTSVAIPNSVTSIGNTAFKGCTGLTSVAIPNSVTSIGNNAFSGCTGLTSITIPNSVTSIGHNAFRTCTNLNSVHISDLATWCKIQFSASHSSPLYYAHNLYLNGELVTDLVIPEGITALGDRCLYGCTHLKSVTIPDDVTSIGANYFADCSGLEFVIIGSGLTNTGKEVFLNCSTLTSISCKAVTPPTLGTNAFNGVNNSIPLYVPAESVEAYKAADQWKAFIIQVIPCVIDGIAYSLNNNLTASVVHGGTYTGDIVIPSSVTYNDVTYSVTSIGSEAFSRCTGLTSVTISNSVTSIGEFAFDGCSSLTSVTIPNSVTSIGDWAFADCSGLTSIEIPNSVTSIGDYAFIRCTSLSSVIISNSVTSIGEGAFYNCTGLSTISLGDNVSLIGDNAFAECSGLFVIEIPASVVYIGTGAFSGCSNMNAINVSVNNTSYCSIDGVLFSGDTTQIIRYPTRREGTYAIPQNVKTIAVGAFSGSNLTSITIPNSLDRIESSSFYSCAYLTSIIIPEGVTQIGEKAFEKCTSLTSVDLQCNIITLEKNCFSGCKSLSTITIPNSVIVIGDGVFRSCPLKSVTIPVNVDSIAESAFIRCSELSSIQWEAKNCKDFTNSPFQSIRGQITSLIFGNEVEVIPAYLCKYEDKLTSITNYSYTPQTLGTNVFLGVNKSICTLYVPSESIELYRAADQWKEFTNIQPIPETKIPCESQILHDTTVTCQGEKIPWIPMTISTDIPGSYDYYDSLKSVMDCDSIRHYHVIVYPSYEFIYDTMVYEGDAVKWHRWELKPEKAGMYHYYDSLRTSRCDSVYVLNLEVKPIKQKMCSWLVESNDIEMGAVITTFENEYYKYGTQITVEASPNSGYKFVKWNDGKKFNPYKFTLLDDKYLLAIFMAEEEEQDTTTVQPTSTSATFTWPFIVGGFSYSLTIYLDAACTIPFCTITFNQYGQLIGIHFGNMAPRRMIS